MKTTADGNSSQEKERARTPRDHNALKTRLARSPTTHHNGHAYSSRPEPFKCKCVATRVTRKAVSYVKCGVKIEVEQHKETAFSVVTDGSNTYMSSKNGDTPEFEARVSYLVKNHTLSNKYGKPSIFKSNRQIKIAPLSLTEDLERRAKEILVPNSPLVSLDKVDPSEEGNLTARMALFFFTAFVNMGTSD
ncbi:hypothetical protein ROHU_008979 [Labeo rohita]|uniref:Uncharacterized protein n=1 Tax=Labeo rohita TaxID=84645 RepID=A0A498MAX2_LABRO|nr:hypothetical protein ROHU_008979 [Labeo rohita]